jgi:hypothetical protein
MRKSLVIGAAILLVSGAANASERGQQAAGGQLRSMISGKTIYLQTPIGAEVPVRYLANGTITGSTSVHLAALGGEKVNKDVGRWWVRSSQLCQRWNNWSNGRAFCYKLSIDGNKVSWVRNDGTTGTARLSK